jgi:ribonuclease-3
VARRGGRLAGLEARIGHGFAKPELVREALTHASLTGRSRRQPVRTNERLEFLGDRVLGLIVADLVIHRFPDEPEGSLTPRFHALVRKEALAEIAGVLDLASALRLAPGGDPANPAILADSCEALIGAIYLDGGLGAAEAFVHRHWSPRLEAMTEPPRDPKTELQEWAQGRGLTLPRYALVDTAGPDHAPVFEVEVAVSGFPPAKGRGASKRAAEQAAAADLLRAVVPSARAAEAR